MTYCKRKSIQIWPRYRAKTVSFFRIFPFADSKRRRWPRGRLVAAKWLLSGLVTSLSGVGRAGGFAARIDFAWFLGQIWMDLRLLTLFGKHSSWSFKPCIERWNPSRFGRDFEQKLFHILAFFVLLISSYFTLEGCPDQRPHPRGICIKGRFWGVFWTDVVWCGHP